MPSKALYNLRKQSHLCTRCGKRDEHTEAGNTLCYECAEKGSAWQKAHYDRETNTIRTRWYISKRIAQGKCIRCASAASPGHVMCEKHLARAREDYVKRKGRKKNATE